MFTFIKRFLTHIWYPPGHPKRCIREEKWMREELTERQIDKILKDSFPCSDPPGRY